MVKRHRFRELVSQKPPWFLAQQGFHLWRAAEEEEEATV
jgi:hypothetical protein